ncbi:MAG: hypothetical protein LBD29_07080 [Treponema sp.]|jgi:chromosome segregation ATPase|nr:hypothetical protein [Treponema sp.]
MANKVQPDSLVHVDRAADAEIVFDTGSGISEDEQRDILAQINGIAEKQRRSLSEVVAAEGKQRFKAKKSGGLFPLLVNMAALALLAGGFFLLSSFQSRTDTVAREGTKLYSSDERALIEEIRRETSTSIEEKENEISLISSKLSEVDAALQELHSDNQELKAEQQATEQQLLALQEEYRSALAMLQDERSRILEEARMKEAELQAQLDARTRELSIVTEQSSAAISYAQGELARISTEQEKAAGVESQLGAFFANLAGQIRENRLAEAQDTLKAIKEFLFTPAFQSLRSIQARRDLYARNLDSLELMVTETRKSQEALAASGKLPDEEAARALAELQERYSQQEKAIEELKQSLAEGSDLGKQLADSKSLNSSLMLSLGEKEREIGSLKTVSSEKDRSIEVLRSEREELSKAAEELRGENTRIQTGLNSANRELGELRPRVQTLSTLNSTLSSTIQELTDQLNRQNPQEE